MSVTRAQAWARSASSAAPSIPIHNGHLRTAFELREALRLAEVRFLPTGNPPHRDQTQASAEMRLALVRAAVADEPGFSRGRSRDAAQRACPIRSIRWRSCAPNIPHRSHLPAAGHGCIPGPAELASLARDPGAGPCGRGASAGLEGADAGTAGRGHGRSRHGHGARAARADGGHASTSMP